MNYTNGEHYLLLTAPFYKKRYTVDGDFIIGCTIGCQFCYYRWIEGTSDLIGTGKLKRVATPETMAEFIENSKIIRKNKDILMLSARSDASFQTKDIGRFLEIYPHQNKVFILHRGSFSKRTVDDVEDPRVVYCTTITPGGHELGWTSIKEELQIKDIEELLKNNIPAERISIEVGSINEHTVDKALEIIQTLKSMGFQFLTYRGVSIGSFNVDPQEEKLEEIKFKTGQKENAPETHSYYKIKNYLSDELENKIRNISGIRLHRFTGTLYREEFNIEVPYNRHNKYRKELGQFSTSVNTNKLAEYMNYLGYSVYSIELTEEGYVIETDRYVTEDIAMTVGAEFNTSVIFKKYRIAPTMEDIEFYKRNRIFYIKE
jgi:nitrogen regulatory protein PII-like uncharacterized protein